MKKIGSFDKLVIGQNVVISYLKPGTDKPAAYVGSVIEHGNGPAGSFVKIDTDRGPRSFTLDRIAEIEIDD